MGQLCELAQPSFRTAALGLRLEDSVASVA